MEERRRLRRRADSATVAGDRLLLYRPSGEIARIAVVVDQLDDGGRRTPLVEDVLSAFPHAELHVADDRRALWAPVGGRTPVVWARPTARGRGFWPRRRRVEPAAPDLGDYDLVLRIGDRRSRSFLAHPDALDLSYILAVEPDDAIDGRRRIGESLRDRCAMQSADLVWCGTRRLLATLRRRWGVDAQLLYPPAELVPAPPQGDRRRVVLAAADDISPMWNARLDTLARWRADLDVVKHGEPSPRRPRRGAAAVPATVERFRDLVAEAVAVVLPAVETFDPRAVWAAQAGVPVVTPMAGAAAELIDGLERRAPTGVLLEEATDVALADGIGFVQRHRHLFEPERLRAHAQRWSHGRFRQTLKSLVLDAWCAHVATAAGSIDGGAAPVERRPATDPVAH